MRTTLTLDDDVVKLIEDEVHRARRPFKQVVNDAIRRGLAPSRAARVTAAYRVKPHSAELQPGLDRNHLNTLADEIEDYSILGAVGASRAAEPRRK